MDKGNEAGRPARGRPACIGSMYSVQGDIIPNPKEQRLLAMASRMREGKMSFRAIALELNRYGFTNRQGRRLSANNVWWLFRESRAAT